MKASDPLCTVSSLALVLCAALLLWLAPGAAHAGLPGPMLDHYQAYPIAPPTALDGPVVQIDDQFGTQVTDLDRTVRFLVPTDKNDEGIFDPISHLTCYRISDGNPAPPVISTNQFGVQPLTLGAPDTLCVPTEKLISPGQVSVDHYKCYVASGAPLGVGVQLQDQFELRSTVLLDPRLFCAPAIKNNEGTLIDPVTHLTCYDTESLGQAPGPVPILNQFLAAPAQIGLDQSNLLCVPSTKSFPAPLDHFTVYDATGQDGPVVTIDDQFYSQTTDLGDTKLFMVPADKNQEGIGDPFSHLTCYEINAAEVTVPVTVTNQFVTDEPLVVTRPTELCVPTEKLIDPGPVDIDHFKCYEVTGQPIDVSLTLQDQFEAFGSLAADPFRLCNPASKNGEAIDNPNDHLVCYLLAPPGPFIGTAIPIDNQFFSPGSIDIGQAFAVCAPSTKVLPEPAVATGLASGVLLLAGLARRRLRRLRRD